MMSLRTKSPSLPAKTVLSFACGFTNCGLSAIRFSMRSLCKIKGFRIELEEIEAVLIGHPAVLECALKVKETSDTLVALVAFLVKRSGQPLPEPANLRAFLSGSLPDYMIPAEYISLDVMPHTSGGKIDRQALQEKAIV